ncbi:MAG: cytochrome c biogenesis protein CcsA [Planctomycetota bacterium]|jgi:heme exporter protein C|nr:cytochrome c biogenesis protein CcsA [Planctomycetota bacterium]
MQRAHPWAVVGYWSLTAVVLLLAVVLAIDAPVDATMGPIQKLLYLHLPVAANAFLGAMVVFVASIGGIGGRRQPWEDLGHAAAIVTVLNATVLLVTGVLWAKTAWGVWWTWSPRLTFSLALWLLYCGYLIVHGRISSPATRGVITAIYGMVAFIDVPLVYLAAKMLPDVHSRGLGITPAMQPALWMWFLAITLVSGGLIDARFRIDRGALGRWRDQHPLPPSPSAGALS